MPAQDADTVQEVRASVADSGDSQELQIQPAGFLIQLSLDWIVLRASENVGDFLGESHVTLIEEPLSRFAQAQALHDLRNHFSRLSGSTGVARAYRVRLTDDRPRFDIAFQVSGGRVLLEAVPSPERGLGEAVGAVGGLVDGLAGLGGQALLEGAARRLRALTGYDRCLIESAGNRAESCRAASAAPSGALRGLPAIVAETAAAPVPIFPRKPGDRSVDRALLKSPSAGLLEQLRGLEIGSAMNIPLVFEGEDLGVIQCESRSPREPHLELHAAAEMFAQMLALRLEIDRLRG
jgi:light-regulated signal transduction histidine kinase (bacteriophytochrome)